MLTMIQAETPQQIAMARELMTEYATALGFNLCFQNFDEEMWTLPGKYAPPSGRILLATWNGQAAGVVAMRATEEHGICEMKRLHVRPAFRGKSLGPAPAERLIAAPTEIWYPLIRLHTLLAQ